MYVQTGTQMTTRTQGIMRYRSEYGLFSHGQLYVACSRAGKPDNLFICTDNGTAENVVYSQVLRS